MSDPHDAADQVTTARVGDLGRRQALAQRGVVLTRVLALAACLVLLGCQTSPNQGLRSCPDEILAEWEIGANRLVRPLSPEQAQRTVLTGNIPMDTIRERWEALRNQRQAGDQYWLYYRPKEPWIHAVEAEEGVVLIRGCSQVGFVTTSMSHEEEP